MCGKRGMPEGKGRCGSLRETTATSRRDHIKRGAAHGSHDGILIGAWLGSWLGWLQAHAISLQQYSVAALCASTQSSTHPRKAPYIVLASARVCVCACSPSISHEVVCEEPCHSAWKTGSRCTQMGTTCVLSHHSPVENAP
mmetsp:Transcript_52394/g.117710  ORF Transcript_52394/g.117710 Transcript_52394/m.117710 type:complete len:141 (-) Transcript_52394:154-576(-)